MYKRGYSRLNNLFRRNIHPMDDDLNLAQTSTKDNIFIYHKILSKDNINIDELNDILCEKTEINDWFYITRDDKSNVCFIVTTEKINEVIENALNGSKFAYICEIEYKDILNNRICCEIKVHNAVPNDLSNLISREISKKIPGKDVITMDNGDNTCYIETDEELTSSFIKDVIIKDKRFKYVRDVNYDELLIEENFS